MASIVAVDRHRIIQVVIFGSVINGVVQCVSLGLSGYWVVVVHLRVSLEISHGLVDALFFWGDECPQLGRIADLSRQFLGLRQRVR